MKFRIHSSRLFFALLALVSVSAARAAEQEIDLLRTGEGGWPPPVPVSISGFTGEVDSVLKNDLLFMGMKNVGPEEAKFLIAGSNSGRVEARVLERISKNTVLAKAYTGGTQRSQTHALADDIALALTGRPGIAQTKITFKVESGPGRSEIYIADYDGHNAQAVTHDQTLVAAPCWAGRSVLFYASYKLGQPCIFSHQLTSGARSAVARFSGANISPAVSPDGKKLAMILSKSGSPNLYVSDPSGGNLKQLTFSREGESSPCWSPDSQTICFVSRERGPASMFTISAHGADKRRLITNLAPSPTEPDWSPDGKWIVFTSQRHDFEICIVSAQGGNAIDLVPGEDPTWAPNSRAVIFCKGPDHAKKLSLLDVPTKQVKDVARILESNSQPSWAR